MDGNEGTFAEPAAVSIVPIAVSTSRRGPGMVIEREKVSPCESAGRERVSRLVWPDCGLLAWLDRALDPPP